MSETIESVAQANVEDKAKPVAEVTRGIRKTRKGVVVSKSGDKTIVVKVERRYQHPLYGKTLKDSTKCHTHDEENKAKVGDKVLIMETRPLSRMKRWRLVEIEGAPKPTE